MTARNRTATTEFRNMTDRYLGLLWVSLAIVALTSGYKSAAANDEQVETQNDRATTDRDGDDADDDKKSRAAAELGKRVRVLRKGSSSRASRKAAFSKLPIDKLKREDQERAVAVLRSASMFRELPLLECDVEEDVYRYFSNHPDMAVSIWRAMKISVFKMSQTGRAAYDVDSGDGTTGKVDVLHQTDDETLVICEGLFKNPLILKPINATGLFHLETKMERREDGTSVATHRGRMFVAFPSQAVGTVAKVISPVSNVIIDRNFREVSLFLHMMTTAMQRQPGWIEHISERLEGVSAEKRIALLKLTAAMYVEARKRKLIADGKPADGLNVDDLLPPTEEDTPPKRVASQPMSR